MNFIDSTVVEENGKLFVQFGNVKLPIPEEKAAVVREKNYVGKTVVLGIRPENLNDDENFVRENPNFVVDAFVEVTELMGSETYLYLTVEGSDVTAKVSAQSKARAEQTIKLGFDMRMIHLFDKETELSIL
jgi:multiple sugar transport system ATP-binding protein